MSDKSDKINPTAKLPLAAANGGAKPTFPANKPQPLNAPRPMYRPKQPSPRRNNRSCFCCCCLWTTFLAVALLLLIAGAGAIFWFIYRPQRPDFTVDSVQLSQLSLSAAAITSKLSLTLSARNPSKKVTFLYDPITVSLFSGEAVIGSGSLPGFVHAAKNSTTLKANVASSSGGETLSADQISTMKSAISNKSRFPVRIVLDTKLKIKAGGLRSKRVGIRVSCDGIRVAAPAPAKKSLPSTAVIPNQKCKVDLRIKIWKWNF